MTDPIAQMIAQQKSISQFPSYSPDPIVTETISMEAGALMRGPMRRAIKRECDQRGLSYTLEEDNGLLDSYYKWQITGRKSAIASLWRWIQYIQDGN